MFKKAMLFNDPETARKILRSSSPGRHQFPERKVSGFKKVNWQKQCRQFAYESNYGKFTQNNNIKEALLATRGKSLGEATRYDRNWGIDLSITNPKKNTEKTSKEKIGAVRSWK